MTSDDLDRVLEINVANVPAVGEVDLDRLRFIVDQSEIALVVQLGDTIAGYCLVLGQGASYDSLNYLWFMERYPDAFYLDRVAFDASTQGRGLGTALYAEVDRLIHERRSGGAEVARLTLEVNVDPPNEQSLAFHGSRGFTEVGRRVAYDGIEVSLMQRVY